MKNYLNEINKLKAENMAISKEIGAFTEEQNALYRFYGKTIFFKATCLEIKERFNEDKLYNAHERYFELDRLIDELTSEYYINERRIEKLREEYRLLHMREAYVPMDEIDIFDKIQKDGFIIAVKF